jgi:predicted oxidoreductase (fatty acid repression mutant protein)
MSSNFLDAMKHRRTYYSIGNSSPISDSQIREIVENAILYVPSAFNSQSSRAVILLGEQHKKLWEIAKDELRKIVPEEAFKVTENKIDTRFAGGYGTILFYEDREVIESLQKQYPLYSENFPLWAEQVSGAHQWAVWTLLEDAGLGVSLQHYNPLIDAEVAKTWNINPKWKLIGEMPFGLPLAEPGEKSYEPIEKRVLLFK